MRSSISSSRRPRAALALIFGAAFLAAVVIGDFLTRHVSWLAYARESAGPLQQLGEGWYIDHGLGVSSLSHKILYHGFGPSIANAQRADVVFLGNSRTLAGFAHDVLDDFADEYGIAYFNFAFGFGEGDVFPRLLLEAHHIRPKLLIVNVEWFFTGLPSKRAQSMIGGSWLRRLQNWIEDGGEYLYRVYGRRFLPHFLPSSSIPSRASTSQGAQGEATVFAFMRSTLNGSWDPWNVPDQRLPVSRKGGSLAIPSAQVARAVTFAEWARRQGSAIVVTVVPSRAPLCSVESARELADRMGATFVAPTVEGLTSFDGAHLSYASAQRFTRAFVRELSRTPLFQRLFPKRAEAVSR